jgi:hypothetical protein
VEGELSIRIVDDADEELEEAHESNFSFVIAAAM